MTNRLGQTAATPLWPIAITRVAIGLLWLTSLRWKLPPDFAPDSGRGLRDWLDLEVEHALFEFYGRLIAEVVLPNFSTFAWILFVTELAVGLALVAGAWTRLAGAVGLLLSVNLGVGLSGVPGEWPWAYVMMAMWHAIFVATAAGRVWGVDAWLRSRNSASTWQALVT